MSDTVAFSFPKPHLGRRLVHLPYVQGMTIKTYLHNSGLVGTRLRCALKNGRGERLRMGYMPRPGDTIVLELGAGPLSGE